MTIQIDEREKEIELYRKNKYNVFPILEGQKGVSLEYLPDKKNLEEKHNDS